MRLPAREGRCPARRPGAGEVLIRVEATGICGTDVHIAEWTPGYEFMAPAMPVTSGMSSLEPSPVGPDVGEVEKGLVTIRPSVVCGYCIACKAGNPDACVNRRRLARNGGFAPLVCVPAENCVPVPAGLDPADRGPDRTDDGQRGSRRYGRSAARQSRAGSRSRDDRAGDRPLCESGRWRLRGRGRGAQRRPTA